MEFDLENEMNFENFCEEFKKKINKFQKRCRSMSCTDDIIFSKNYVPKLKPKINKLEPSPIDLNLGEEFKLSSNDINFYKFRNSSHDRKKNYSEEHDINSISTDYSFFNIPNEEIMSKRELENKLKGKATTKNLPSLDFSIQQLNQNIKIQPILTITNHDLHLNKSNSLRERPRGRSSILQYLQDHSSSKKLSEDFTYFEQS